MEARRHRFECVGAHPISCVSSLLISAFISLGFRRTLFRQDRRTAIVGRSIIGSVHKALTGLALLTLLVASASAAEPRRVVLLHGFGHAYSPWSDMAASFRAELVKASPEPIDLYEVSLDTGRVRDPKDEAPFVEYIRALLAGRKLDLIVPVGAPAAFFVQRHRQQLFPATPTLIFGADVRRIPNTKLTDNDASALLHLDILAMFKNILSVRPGTTDIAVVVGNSPVERFWAEEVQRDVQPLANQVNLMWFNDLTFADILSRAASMPARSAIFWGLFSEDAAGVPYSEDRALDAVRKVANAPIFGTSDYQMGRGIVGGPLLQTRALGQQAAEVALRILNGEQPGRIDPVNVPLGAPAYDWQELQRWGIAEAALPSGSVIQYRQPAIWGQYRDVVLGILAAFAIQTAVLAILLLQMRKRRQAEDSLRESESRFRAMADSAPVLIWMSDTDKLCIFFNTSWLAFTGRTLAQELGDGWLVGVHRDDLDRCLATYANAFDARREFEMEYRLRRHDGEFRWVFDKGVPRYGPDGAFLGYIGSAEDITDRRRMEEEAALQRQEVAHLMRASVLGELSGAMAHEINQPLTAIQSNAETGLDLLKEHSPDLAEMRDVLQDIIHDNRRASAVIQRLRSLLKKGEMTSEWIDINDLAKSTFALINSELIARRITLKLELANELPAIQGDPVQLQQVLLNLAMNAMDAMATTPIAQRLVTVSTRAKQDKSVEVRVTDRGAGIQPAEQGRLFEPFYTTKTQGLGLGLAICSTIVDSHGGNISLANQSGGGAIATLSLPISKMLVVAK